MKYTDEQRILLVVSKTPQLAEAIRKAMERPSIQVVYTSDETEATNIIREKRPDLIVLDILEPDDAALRFYWQIKSGWVSRHSSLLIIKNDGPDRNISGGREAAFEDSDRILINPNEISLSRLREVIEKKLEGRVNKFQAALLDTSNFCVVWEQIPGLGAFEARQEQVIENARKAASGGQVCAISITDNPGGNPAIATDVLCSEIRKSGVEPIVHIAFRDRSRNQAESLLYQLAALEVNNLLVLTGDYPSNFGFAGKSKPVFDLDSVNGLILISEMNRGMEHEIMRKKTRLSPTRFFSGVAFSPFKQMEAEVMGQYFKLKKKIEAGAGFIVTQVGYDVRKWHELQLWQNISGFRVPVIANIYVLSLTVGRSMHNNSVPGCVVTENLLKRVTSESEGSDKGRSSRLERAARMYAIAKGMGLSGAYISGQGLRYESLEYIVARGDELLSNWQDLVHEFDYPQEKGFYYFKKDQATGLNMDIAASREQKSVRPFIYSFSQAVHTVVFEPKSPFFKAIRKSAEYIDKSKLLKKIAHSFEYWTKTALYGCKDCGDCALFDVAYLCTVSQCPKDQRNAPCGGSFQGWCEVYPFEKQCIWVRAYQRLKSQHKEDVIGNTVVPPCNWELWQTSSWLNYFLGRDHTSQRLGIKPPRTGNNANLKL